jgi:septal ring-binding cell division protein DamX
MAVIWWRKSAEQGFGPAQYNLGTAYIEGVGIPRDTAIGAEWYRRAAANGHPLAQTYLDEHATPTKVAPEKPAPASASDIAAPKPKRAESSPAAKAANTATTDISDHTQPLTITACREWLMQGTDKGYSIQLMSNRELSSSTDFIRQHDLADTVACSYSVKNRLWHGVFYGQYLTAREARAALATLPAEIRAGGAYVRRLQEIRDAVEETP